MSKRAFFFGLAVIAVLIFSLYRAKYGARESAEEMAKIDAQIEMARLEQTELLTEFAHRSRQEWIDEIARRDLGMVPARVEQFILPGDVDERLGPMRDQDETVPSRGGGDED